MSVTYIQDRLRSLGIQNLLSEVLLLITLYEIGETDNKFCENSDKIFNMFSNTLEEAIKGSRINKERKEASLSIPFEVAEKSETTFLALKDIAEPTTLLECEEDLKRIKRLVDNIRENPQADTETFKKLENFLTPLISNLEREYRDRTNASRGVLWL